MGFQQNEISGITQYLFGEILTYQRQEFCNQTVNVTNEEPTPFCDFLSEYKG